MAGRAGRTAVIAASFVVQALIFAVVAGDAARQGASPAAITNAPMVISMSIEGQNGTVRVTNPRAGAASPASPADFTIAVLGYVQFAVQPGVDATMRILVNLPAGYPAGSLTFGIVQDGLEYGSAPASPQFPSLTVSQPGPGSRDYAFRWAGSNVTRGGWWLVMSIKWHGAITRVAIAELGT
jgi:hypothetical protein